MVTATQMTQTATNGREMRLYGSAEEQSGGPLPLRMMRAPKALANFFGRHRRSHYGETHTETFVYLKKQSDVE
jgi:hypothetical protein